MDSFLYSITILGICTSILGVFNGADSGLLFAGGGMIFLSGILNAVNDL